MDGTEDVNDSVNDPSIINVYTETCGCFGVPEGSVLGSVHFILYSSPLSLIETHSASNQSLADDTQLLQSCPPEQIHAIFLTTKTCISVVKTWMTQNRLKLNDDKTGKTEVLLMMMTLSMMMMMMMSTFIARDSINLN